MYAPTVTRAWGLLLGVRFVVGLLITWPSPARARARLEGLGPRCNVRELAEGMRVPARSE